MLSMEHGKPDLHREHPDMVSIDLVVKNFRTTWVDYINSAPIVIDGNIFRFTLDLKTRYLPKSTQNFELKITRMKVSSLNANYLDE